jgi:hypothetical protein
MNYVALATDHDDTIAHDGAVDAATWEFHRGPGDFSRWIGLSVKDRESTAEIADIE